MRINQRKPDEMALWDRPKTKKTRKPKGLRGYTLLIVFNIWLRGQDLLKALLLKSGYKGVAGAGFEPTTFRL